MAAPPVVLVHGFASTFEHDWQRTGWVDVLEGEGRRVLAVDLPGHGRAPRDPESVSPAEVLQAVVRGGPVDGVGFSAGGHALIAAAVAAPGAFRRLVLMGVGAVPGAQRADRGPAVADLFEADVLPTDPVSRLLFRLADSSGNDRRMLARVLRASHAEIQPEQLAALTMPALIVVGEHDFTGSGEELAELIPSAELLVLRGADHFSTLTNLRCLDAVVAFLAG